MDKKVFSLEGVTGALFDMDGTMIDNQPFHRKAWLEFAKRHGFGWSEEEILEKTSGKKNAQILPVLLERDVSPEEIDQLANEKEEIYRELYRGNITPIEGLRETVDMLKKRGIKVAVATTAQKNNREFILGGLGITDELDAVVGEEHFTNGKPDPELFLKAADALGVDPTTCIVFDDAPIGIEAANRAGMKLIGITTTHSEDEFKGADLIVHTFSEIAFS